MINAIKHYGPPPSKQKGSCTHEDGYWVIISKRILGKAKVSHRHVKIVYSKYKKNKEIQENIKEHFDKVSHIPS